MQDLLGHAKDLAPSVVALRRDLHRWPELGLHTPRTRDAVLAALEGLPLDVTLHDTTSGVAALLTGGYYGTLTVRRGYDDVTGLGSPSVPAIAKHLRRMSR